MKRILLTVAVLGLFAAGAGSVSASYNIYNVNYRNNQSYTSYQYPVYNSYPNYNYQYPFYNYNYSPYNYNYQYQPQQTYYANNYSQWYGGGYNYQPCGGYWGCGY
ncbi:hypothetical protein EXS62_02780 [Candidatus Kaiserbacteria bacterium]|nr:hypothetical protein [Candidatus Kaiserbacteria bacterium]